MKENKDIKSPLQFVKGVGPKKADAFLAEGISDLPDLIEYYPVSYISRSSILSIDDLIKHLSSQQRIFTEENFNPEQEISLRSEFTIQAKVIKKDTKRLRGKKELLTLIVSDGSKFKAKVNFWKFASYFSKMYPLDSNLLIMGKAEWDQWGLSFTHPEIEKIDDDVKLEFDKGKIIPNYRIGNKLSKAKINSKLIRSLTHEALKQGVFIENLPQEFIKRNALPLYENTIKNIHFPESGDALHNSLKRFKFEELFYYQLLIQKNRIEFESTEQAPIYNGESPSARTVYEKLPFELTSDQKRSLNEIAKDLSSGKPMNRLLQGDVGSGKTITSLLSMLMMVDSGYQCAMLAPTEILSEQHFAGFFQALKELGIKPVLLSGGQRTKERREVLEKIKSGEANIVIGTHAAFLNEIEYNKLGYIVIDEQHRFGVAQRAKIREMASASLSEGQKPHILIMSATPIPRTLEMTFYGDLEVSTIRSKPVGRKEIKTRILFDSEINKAYDFINREVSKGRQAFIVYPLVEKSEKLDLKAAEEEFLKINESIFPHLNCGLIHGRMNSEEKDFIMNKFKEKKFDILVSTTVIEVGIDIPNANIMMIENSERFGLSQLHQLRGRVGRGEHQSYCLLVAPSKYKSGYEQSTEVLKIRNQAMYRLKTMEATTDGFKIAEADLKLRGPGDLLGTKQSGMPDFKFADLIRDIEIIRRAKSEAIRILSDDPDLSSKENEGIRENMNRFKKINRSFFDIA